MKQIRVERQAGFYGMVRSLEIIADGLILGRISQGAKQVFDVPESCREIWGKMDWGETVRLDVSNYDPTQTVVFKAFFTFNLLKGVGIGPLPFKVFFSEGAADESNFG